MGVSDLKRAPSLLSLYQGFFQLALADGSCGDLRLSAVSLVFEPIVVQLFPLATRRLVVVGRAEPLPGVGVRLARAGHRGPRGLSS